MHEYVDISIHVHHYEGVYIYAVDDNVMFEIIVGALCSSLCRSGMEFG